ncbi:MAG: Cna B-type domain-containing protein, partial [Lachnospiraceae bacterium]|nr:Cna B-type domain-containing protein [Lachnospiraceae bacterium]
QLLANGTAVGEPQELSEKNEWTWTFTELPVNKTGKEIEYTVEEVHTDVITGTDGKGTYLDKVTGDAVQGYTITNTHTPVPKSYKITYKLNGGVYNGSEADIIEEYPEGTVISIHEAPTREGYIFLYWEGSLYQPGDEYTVVEDHVFTAQWMEEETPPDTRDRTRPECWFLLMLLSMIAVVSAFLIAGDRRPRKAKRRTARR